MAEGADHEDRTEEPTQRRLDEAIKRGDVAKSPEINTLFVLGAFTLGVLMLSGPIAQSLTAELRGFLTNAHAVPADGAGMIFAARRALLIWLAAVAAPIGLVLLGGIIGGAIQHRPLWTAKPLAPQLSRISPLAGAKRLFGKDALFQFAKGLLKIMIVGAVGGAVLFAERHRLEALAQLSPGALLSATFALTIKLLGGVLAIYAFLALGDFAYQRFAWHRRQRMTKQELKEEFKESEGNPEVKARLRQIRAARLKKRMMAAVPEATVVVTNPTHFAVALKYEKGMQAPVCVAKGVDSLALRIRAVAGEHGVPVVENPPLARALHASVDIDEEIPVEHYKAVAEVIGYVLRLRRR